MLQKCFLCYVLSPVIIESWMLLPHWFGELTLRLTNTKDRLHSQCMSCCTWATPGDSYSKLVLPSSPFDMPLVWPVESGSFDVWSLPLVVLVLGLLNWCSYADSCQMLCVTSLGLLFWSYHFIDYYDAVYWV